MLPYLKRCRASVADQTGVTVEHLVQDAHSTDGTHEWLTSDPLIQSSVESDAGMYDALNRGIDRATGSIIAYLNCDEQYLEDTLKHVKATFDKHPDIDLVFGHALLIRPDNSLISYRKAYQPRRSYILSSHLYTLSCTMFVRRRVFDEGLRFNAKLRSIADCEFVTDALSNGHRARVLKRYLSAFTMTGGNMSNSLDSRQETLHAKQQLPTWIRLARPLLNMARLTEKALSGAYHQSFPLSYDLYDASDTRSRKSTCANTGSFRWKFE